MECEEIFAGYKHYNKDWLINEFENGINLKYLYFWGHTTNADKVGKECFSQWYPSPFKVNNVVYKTAEHWMMAQKAQVFNNTELFQRIVDSEKPAVAKELGRAVIGFDEVVWDKVKYDLVKIGNIHKFNQHTTLLNVLLTTHDRVLVEASPVDKIWGAGLAKDSKYIDNLYAWPGQNLLGFALMEVRDFLSEFGPVNDTGNWLPPQWIKYPNIDPYDMFWRMGNGERYVMQLAEQDKKMDKRTATEYFLNNPMPYEWRYA